ncbi:MAG: C69 family dipeptidase [Promethearchaeota archaeon]
MCDTLVALGNSTEDGSVIFGKNSDRPDDEVQLITYNPRKRYSKGEELECTYISIPQVSETYAVLLSQPWWMWGAEMGANEYGVVIGNEAIYSRELLRSRGLLGMDLLRLGLERGKNALEALKVITDLLEKYHQGGGCAYGDSSWMYHNSFLIADPKEAYVLETADDWWAAEKVKDVRSISNSASIRGKGDLRRKGIIEYAIERGYCKDDDDFDFALSFCGSAPSYSKYSRAGMSAWLLNENKGKINPTKMMEFLREHQAGICMHGGFESAGSQVSHLREGKVSIHWFTGTTLPCMSVYKPYIFPADGQIYYEAKAYNSINKNWNWYKHALYIRHIDRFSKKKELNNYYNSIENLEASLLEEIKDLIDEEENISNSEFIEKIKKLNKKAWQESMNLIKID